MIEFIVTNLSQVSPLSVLYVFLIFVLILIIVQWLVVKFDPSRGERMRRGTNVCVVGLSVAFLGFVFLNALLTDNYEKMWVAIFVIAGLNARRWFSGFVKMLR